MMSGKTNGCDRVSTIIPVYNREAMIRDAVNSVLAQSHPSIEIVLVDDGSTDNTWRALQDLQAQHRDLIKIAQQDNAGPGAARNRGFQIATGDFIQYLDSDDVLHPDKFALQVKMLQANPDAGVCYCITLRKNKRSGKFEPWARTAESIDDLFPSFLPKRGWATLTPLWRRSVCEAVGPWKPFRVMEDWEHDLRAGLLGVKPIHVPVELCTVIDHDEDRASGMNDGFTKDRMMYFFQAHESIWRLMKEHERTDWAYLESFSRTMFWIARMCGERGLERQADAALDYADEMTKMHGRPNATRRFRQLKSILGWRLAVGLAERLRKNS